MPASKNNCSDLRAKKLLRKASGTHTIPACDFEASLRVLYSGGVIPSPKVTHLATGRTKVLASGLQGLPPCIASNPVELEFLQPRDTESLPLCT